MFNFILIGSALILLLCFAVFFRDDVKLFVSKHYVHLFSCWKIWDTRDKIEKIDVKIEEIKKKKVTKTDFKLQPVGIEDTYTDKIQKRYDRICKFIDYGIASISEEKKSFDEFDRLQTGEKIDKLIRMEIQLIRLQLHRLVILMWEQGLIGSSCQVEERAYTDLTVTVCFLNLKLKVLKERLTILFFQRPGKRSTLCSHTIDAWKQAS